VDQRDSQGPTGKPKGHEQRWGCLLVKRYIYGNLLSMVTSCREWVSLNFVSNGRSWFNDWFIIKCFSFLMVYSIKILMLHGSESVNLPGCYCQCQTQSMYTWCTSRHWQMMVNTLECLGHVHFPSCDLESVYNTALQGPDKHKLVIRTLTAITLNCNLTTNLSNRWHALSHCFSTFFCSVVICWSCIHLLKLISK